MDLTIYFDGQYWSGLVEYQDTEGHLRVYRHVFGSEPKDQDIQQFVCTRLPKIIEGDWYSEVQVERKKSTHLNPKRMQRMLQRQKKKPILSTKAQLAMTEQREAMKKQRQQSGKKRKLEEKQYIFEKKQQKRQEKRKGH